MKKKDVLEIFSLISGVSAVIVILFFLISGWGKCIILFEPNPFIRVPEIIFGVISIPVLIILIWRKL